MKVLYLEKLDDLKEFLWEFFVTKEAKAAPSIEIKEQSVIRTIAVGYGPPSRSGVEVDGQVELFVNGRERGSFSFRYLLKQWEEDPAYRFRMTMVPLEPHDSLQVKAPGACYVYLGGLTKPIAR